MWKKLSKKKKGLFFFIVFIIIAWFLIPALLKNYINNNSKDIFGRKANISSLGFNYFTGSINAKDFIIYDENETDTLFFTSKAHTNLNFYSYLKGDYIFEKINIDGLQLNLILNDTVLNLNTVINHLFSSDESGSSAQLKFKKISIKNSSVSYNDKIINSYACAKKLNIQTLKEFSADELVLQVKTDFELESGGKIISEFIYDFKNTQYDIIFNSNEFDLAVLHPYLVDLTYSKGSGGIYNSEFRASGFINKPIETSLTGKANLHNVFLKDSSNNEIASFNNLAIDVDSINLSREFFDLKKIKLDKPFAKLIIDKHSDNFNNMIKYDSIVYSEGSYSNVFVLAGKYISALIQQIKVTNFSVDSLNINDINLDFTDNSLIQPFKYTLAQGRIISSNITSNNDSIHVDFMANLKNKGTVNLTGIFNSVDPDNMYGNIILKNVMATDFSPYCYEYFGLPILQGDLYINANIIIKDKQLTNNNRIRFFDLELGKKEKNPNTYNLPIKTAAKVLKNEDGETPLNVNITGDLSDPTYNILSITGQILKNLIEDAATSPSKLLKKKK